MVAPGPKQSEPLAGTEDSSMESIFLTATLWLALAVVSALIASFLRLSIALVEICVGVVAAASTGFFGPAMSS